MQEQPTAPVFHESAKRSEPAPEAVSRLKSMGSGEEARVSAQRYFNDE
jgi:hypothetical protein